MCLSSRRFFQDMVQGGKKLFFHPYCLCLLACFFALFVFVCFYCCCFPTVCLLAMILRPSFFLNFVEERCFTFGFCSRVLASLFFFVPKTHLFKERHYKIIVEYPPVSDGDHIALETKQCKNRVQLHRSFPLKFGYPRNSQDDNHHELKLQWKLNKQKKNAFSLLLHGC